MNRVCLASVKQASMPETDDTAPQSLALPRIQRLRRAYRSLGCASHRRATYAAAVVSFDPALLHGQDEPVRRFFEHAIRKGAPLPPGLRLTMTGCVKADVWLPFAAAEEVDGRSFSWCARVGLGPLTLLRIDDSYAHGVGSTEGRLFGRRPLFHSADEDTARSAAGRAALESVVFAPPSVLPERGVAWRAESEDTLAARFDLPPERPEVEVRIDGQGAVRSVSAARWGPTGKESFDYIPCGCEVHAERTFGDLTIPSSLTVSWRFGTPRQAPFFKARISAVEPRG